MASKSIIESPSYATSFYQSAGIPCCSRCGEKRRTLPGGELFCPNNDTRCPMIVGSSDDGGGVIQSERQDSDNVSTGNPPKQAEGIISKGG